MRYIHPVGFFFKGDPILAARYVLAARRVIGRIIAKYGLYAVDSISHTEKHDGVTYHVDKVGNLLRCTIDVRELGSKEELEEDFIPGGLWNRGWIPSLRLPEFPENQRPLLRKGWYYAWFGQQLCPLHPVMYTELPGSGYLENWWKLEGSKEVYIYEDEDEDTAGIQITPVKLPPPEYDPPPPHSWWRRGSSNRMTYYGEPSDIKPRPWITLPSQFTGLMRQLVQCCLTHNQFVGTEAGENYVPFLSQFTATHGIVEYPQKRKIGKDIKEEDKFAKERTHWLVEITSGGVFATKIEYYDRCEQSYKALGKYIIKTMDGRSFVSLASFYGKEGFEEIKRILPGGSISKAFDFRPWQTSSSIFGVGPLGGDMCAPGEEETGWAFSYSGHEAQIVTREEYFHSWPGYYPNGCYYTYRYKISFKATATNITASFEVVEENKILGTLEYDLIKIMSYGFSAPNGRFKQVLTFRYTDKEDNSEQVSDWDAPVWVYYVDDEEVVVRYRYDLPDDPPGKWIDWPWHQPVEPCGHDGRRATGYARDFPQYPYITQIGGYPEYSVTKENYVKYQRGFYVATEAKVFSSDEEMQLDDTGFKDHTKREEFNDSLVYEDVRNLFAEDEVYETETWTSEQRTEFFQGPCVMHTYPGDNSSDLVLAIPEGSSYVCGQAQLIRSDGWRLECVWGHTEENISGGQRYWTSCLVLNAKEREGFCLVDNMMHTRNIDSRTVNAGWPPWDDIPASRQGDVRSGGMARLDREFGECGEDVACPGNVYVGNECGTIGHLCGDNLGPVAYESDHTGVLAAWYHGFPASNLVTWEYNKIDHQRQSIGYYFAGRNYEEVVLEAFSTDDPDKAADQYWNNNISNCTLSRSWYYCFVIDPFTGWFAEGRCPEYFWGGRCYNTPYMSETVVKYDGEEYQLAKEQRFNRVIQVMSPVPEGSPMIPAGYDSWLQISYYEPPNPTPADPRKNNPKPYTTNGTDEAPEAFIGCI